MDLWELLYRSMCHSRRFTVSFIKNNKQTLSRPRHAVEMETKNLLEQNFTSKIIHTEFVLWKYDLVILAGTARPAVVISGMPHSLANHSLQEIFVVMQTVSMNLLAPSFLIDFRNPISLNISPPDGSQPHCPLHTLTCKPKATPKEGEFYWEWQRETPSDNLMLFTF